MTTAERADGSTPIRRAIAEVLQAAALHMIASPECARAVDRVIEMHLAARRENEVLRDERLILAKLCADEPQFSNPLAVCAAKMVRDDVLASAALAATQEER